MNTLKRITPAQARILGEFMREGVDEFLIQRLMVRAAFRISESDSIREDREGRAMMNAVKALDQEFVSVMNELGEHEE